METQRNSKHYTRSHRYILFYIFAVESVKICRFKTFWMSIFLRGTLLLCSNLVPRARDPLGRGTKGSGINHLFSPQILEIRYYCAQGRSEGGIGGGD